MGTTTSQIHTYSSDNRLDHDESGLEDLPQEEGMRYDSSSEASEVSQWLQEAPPSEDLAASVEEVQKSVENGHYQPSITKQINRYIRKHPFFEKSLTTFTKSERRQFERNVYDFARGLGLNKAEARRHVVKARDFCGEEGYNSDSSTFQGEINDSKSIMETLSASKLDDTAAVSIPTARPSRQVDRSDKIQPAPDIRTRSGEDATSKSIRVNQPSKKRRAKADGLHNDYGPDEEPLNLLGAPVDVTDVGEGAASVSASTKRPSKKRKAKANGMDNDYESALTLLKAPEITAQRPADEINERKVARRNSKKERKGQKRLKIIKRDKSEPRGDKEYVSDSADSQVSTTKEGGREGEKKGEYSSLNDLILKSKACIEQQYDQIKARETRNPRKGRKRQRHRIDDMPVHAILASGDGNKKKSIHQHSSSGDSTSDETGPKELQDLTRPMIQCEELAKILDESFNKMTALEFPSTPSKKSAYPSPDPSPSGRKVLSTSLPLERRQGAQAEDIPRQPDNAVSPTTPRVKSVRAPTVSPYFAKSVQKRIKKTESPYFPSPSTMKPKASDRVSCIPFPSLQATSFGLVQEALAHDPFRLLVAVIFLNKTRGHVALPVFYQLMERYPTPADLAAANLDDVVDIIQCLGLQNQRAATCINLAKAWLERPPERGKRYRVLHYPNKDDGKDIKTGEIIDEDDDRIGWEIGQLPGVGAYAIDSWRIFCRDELCGLPTGLPKELTSEAKAADMEKEWARVLPLDKELRAYLRWRWLRNGWEWDPVTGERKRADVDAIVKVDKGGVMYEGDGTKSLIGRQEIKDLTIVKTELKSALEEELSLVKP